MRSWALVALLAVVVILPGCQEEAPPPPPPVPPVAVQDYTDAERALLAEAEPYKNMPKEEDLPVPPDGWYTLDLDGEKVDVFRDQYGVPHIFAPTIDSAFRAQGYVICEDRCIQLLLARESVIGFRSSREGAGGLGNDHSVLQHGYTKEERRQFLESCDQKGRKAMQEYIRGANIFLAKYVPNIPPLDELSISNGMAKHVAGPGDVFGGQQLDLYKMLTMVQFLRGDKFMMQMLDDCLPNDVPNSPTSDHSCNGETRRTDTEAISRPLKFEPREVAQIYDEYSNYLRDQRQSGQFTKWGSQAWAVSSERSANGHAMVFSGPMFGFHTPPQAALVHISAPGMNVSGLCFVGVPGIVMGHNENVAWGITSGMVVQTDIFCEELNPENPEQYKYNGQWKDMEILDAPIAVRQKDGTLQIERYKVYRTVHGPVIHWVKYNNRAYTRNSTFRYHEIDSYMALLQMNFAKDLGEFEQAVNNMWTSQNFIAGDKSGNIGYWLAGRIPIRHPQQDPRLPTPGTGEYDWQGLTVASELVRCVNPEEGWVGNFNNKPSIKTPGWWPEVMWGKPIFDELKAHNPITWDEFININRVNGEHSFAGPFLKPYLIRLLREKGAGEPRMVQAAQMLEKWPDRDVANEPAALLLNEWMPEVMIELLTPDFKGVIKRDMSRENLQLFGLLTFRVLCPERSGVVVKGDYLHGRDKDEMAYKCAVAVMDRLAKAHGDDMAKWPYKPVQMDIGEDPKFDTRNCGVFWMATELGERVHAMEMLVPGQSGHHKSPHIRDQRPLFDAWQLMDTKFYPDEFIRR